MRILLTTALLCLLAPPAAGQGVSLQGQWDAIPPNHKTSGTILIDAERRVTWDLHDDRRKTASYLGYVARVDAAGAEILLTDRSRNYGVVRLNCTIQSSELLHCFLIFGDGSSHSAPIIASKTGPGPARLTQAPR